MKPETAIDAAPGAAFSAKVAEALKERTQPNDDPFVSDECGDSLWDKVLEQETGEKGG